MPPAALAKTTKRKRVARKHKHTLTYTLSRLRAVAASPIKRAIDAIRTAGPQDPVELAHIPEHIRCLLVRQRALMWEGAASTASDQLQPRPPRFVLGIDIGVRNLAFCLLDLQNTCVLDWDCVDVLSESGLTKKPVAPVLHTLVVALLASRMDRVRALDSSNPEHDPTIVRVVIEQQPKQGARGRANAAIADAIFAHFATRYPTSFAQPSCRRLSKQERPTTPNRTTPKKKTPKNARYANNKRRVVDECTKLLNTTLATWPFSGDRVRGMTPLQFFCGRCKNDDLADAFLLAWSVVTDQQMIMFLPVDATTRACTSEAACASAVSRSISASTNASSTN